MELENIIRSALEVSIIIPLGIICLVTFIDKLKIKASYATTILLASFSALSIAGGFLRLRFHLNINFVMLVATILMFVYIMAIIKEKFTKIIYVFLSASALISSGTLFGYLLEAHYNENNTFNDTQTWGLVLRFAIIVATLIVFVVILPKVRWLVNCTDINKIWKIMWVVPSVFTVSNVIMVPHYYIYMSNGRTEGIYVTISIVLLFMHLLFMFMIYFMAKTVTEKSKLDKQAQMLSIQASQYEGLQRHIEATSKLRHDFKHTVRTAVSLAQEGKNNDLIKLLSDYGAITASTDKRSVFTKNSTLNALICYYYEQALSKNIFCNWNVSLPEKLDVEDIDLFGIIGNLLENAIHASENENADNRYINLKADVEDNGDIYIVTTNGFSGKIKKDHDKYLSTKKGGSGIGIESIKSTVKRYNGIASFYNDPKTFYADIMLKQNL